MKLPKGSGNSSLKWVPVWIMGCLRVERGGLPWSMAARRCPNTYPVFHSPGQELYDGQTRDGDVGKIECMVERWERESGWFVCWERGGTGDAMEEVRTGPLWGVWAAVMTSGGQTDLNGLWGCHLRPWWCLGPCFHQELCLGPWSYYSWSLCCCVRPALPSKAMQMFVVWAATWSPVVVWALYWADPIPWWPAVLAVTQSWERPWPSLGAEEAYQRHGLTNSARIQAHI